MFGLRSVVGFAFLLVACFALFPVPCEAARWRTRGGGHAALVSQSGISPVQVGTHEGIGVSSVSFADAERNACYWGKRTVVSIQHNYRNGKFYAVVRYQ